MHLSRCLVAIVLPLVGCAPGPAPLVVDPVGFTTVPAASSPPPSSPSLLPEHPVSSITPRRYPPRRDDLSGDGHPDFAVGAPTHRRVTVYVSGVAPVVLDSALGGFGATLAYAGDLDGDGFSDLAVGAPDADAVALFAGTSDGIDPLPRAVLHGPSGSRFGATLIAIDDTDGDGRDDLVIGSPAGHAVSLVRGRNGTMPTAIDASFEGPADEGFASGLVAMDGGRVAVAVPGEGAVVVMTARESVFQERARLVISPTRVTDLPMAALDANGDGRTDLAVVVGAFGVAWIYGTADGFAAPSPGPGGAGAGTLLANATDLDHDGRDELLLASGAGLWMIPGGSSEVVSWDVERSGTTGAVGVYAWGDGAAVLRGVPGEDVAQVFSVDEGGRSITLRATLMEEAGSAFGAAVAR